MIHFFITFSSDTVCHKNNENEGLKTRLNTDFQD